MLGNDDLRRPGSRRRGRGARAAVMDDGGHPLEEGLLVHVADR